MEFPSSKFYARPFAAAGIAAALCVIASTALPQAAPFAGMAGSWAGAGRIDLQNGTSERIRCRARYGVAGGGHSLHQELRCASDSYKFEVTSDIQAQGSTVSGTWSEASRNVTGTVSGTVSGGRIRARVEGGLFSASITVVTTGSRQAVTIVPAGSDVRGVAVALARG